MKILFIDDESGYLEQADAFLAKDNDLSLKTTTSPSEALKLLDEENFDAIISDYKMPEMDGLRLLKTVRKEKEIDIPFVIFTGKGTEDVAMKALNLGADRYLKKGDDPKSKYRSLLRAVIEERDRLGRRLRESEEKYRALVEQVRDGIYIYGEGGIQFVNRRICDITGYEKEKLRGMDIEDIFHPEDREKVEEIVRRHREGEDIPDTFSARIETKEGDVRHLELAVTEITYEGKAVILGSARDITERKKAEDREEFLHSLLRHDVRNKAQIAQGYYDLIQESDVSEEKGERYIEKANKAVRDCVKLIEKVKTLRKVGEERETEPVNVDLVLKNVLSEQGPMAAERGMDIDFEDCRCEVQGGPLLEELFSNLVENSIFHSGGDRIEISPHEEDDSYVISIEDDGRGIPDEEKEKIFDRGYKSEESSGSGLGTYLARRVAESYGGEIEVRDSDLGGARFDVRLRKA